MRVCESFLELVYVREDGLISVGTPDGPWSPGQKQLMNYEATRKGRKPAYYFRYWTAEGKGYLVHRLVACAFCENPNPDAFKIVDHIDGCSLSNVSSNLRWVNTRLNQISNRARNTYWDRRYQKWQAKVAGNSLGFFFVEREAWLVAQKYKAELFRKIYRSFILNESETTRTCQHIHGRVPVTDRPAVPNPGDQRVGVQLPKTQRLHNQLPTALQEGVVFSTQVLTPTGGESSSPDPVKHPPQINELANTSPEGVPSKQEGRSGSCYETG